MGGERTIRVVIGILRDGERGYSDFAESLENAGARAFFLEESRVRAVFALELERVLQELTGAEWASNGTSLGMLHRSWTDLQLAFHGTDRTIFATTARCEEYAVAGYDASLADTTVPPMALEVLQRQGTHVRRALGMVRKYLEESLGEQSDSEEHTARVDVEQDAG